jgi:hypothetical protein
MRAKLSHKMAQSGGNNFFKATSFEQSPVKRFHI